MRRRTEAEWRDYLKQNVTVDPVTGCWTWNRSRNPDGYGHCRFMGKTVGIHRISWIIFNGPIPDGFHVLHDCDNPPCGNPEHLFLGTNHDNVLDSKLKGRRASKVGDKNGRAKLTPEQALTILRLKPYGDERLRIAAEYGVSKDAVCNIVCRKTWSHLTP